jgi:hypothetical protein
MTELFTNPRRFTDLHDWHREADELRAQSVVQYVDPTADDYPPFWAVLGLEEVVAVERQTALFTNEPTSVLAHVRISPHWKRRGQICGPSRRWTLRITPSTGASPPTGSGRPASTDFPRMLKLTQELFGSTDDELGRGGGTQGLIQTILDYFHLERDDRWAPSPHRASRPAGATRR